jgi:hypothetical protein
VPDKIHSNTATEQPKKKRGNVQNLVPFKKGKGAERDPKINAKGRPRVFDQLRELILEIGGEIARDKRGNPVIIDRNLETEHAATVAELLLREWAKDKINSSKFIEYGWGKVPTPVEHSGNVTLTWKDFIQSTGVEDEPDPNSG